MTLLAWIAAFALAALNVSPAFAGGDELLFLGPVPYTSESDSEFALRFGFCLENFEDGLFDDAPGVSGNGTVVNPAGNTDSVDGDDGNINGFGTAGRSYFNGNGAGGITITFDPERLEGLPEAAGIVWTDGGFGSSITFQAFGPQGQSLGTVGPTVHADASNAGTTGEDRFYGVINPTGLSAIKISNSSGGIEVDHIQLNRCFLCGDGDTDRGVDASDALLALKAAVGSDDCLECLCDVNESETITAVDSLIILKLAIGLAPAVSCSACGNIM